MGLQMRYKSAFSDRVSHAASIRPTVGDLVREGIENDWPYIFTDAEFEPLIEAVSPRSSRDLTGFGRREPRRGDFCRPAAPRYATSAEDR